MISFIETKKLISQNILTYLIKSVLISVLKWYYDQTATKKIILFSLDFKTMLTKH